MCAPHIVQHVGDMLTAQRSFMARMDAAGAAGGAYAPDGTGGGAGTGGTGAASGAGSTGAPGGTASQHGAGPVRSFSFRHVVDLTHPLSPDFPVFPAFEPMQVRATRTMERDGFFAQRWEVGEHTGTHMDAPAHFATGEHIRTIDQIPAEQLVVPLAVIDVKDRADKDPDTVLTVDDILAYERRHGRIPEGAALCMYTGWETRAGSAQQFLNPDNSGVMHFPGLSPEAAAFLAAERNVAGVGVDTISLDFGPSTDFRAHFEILSRNKWGLECLARLADVPPAGAMLFVGAPKVAGGSGGPTRVLALW